MPTAPGNGFDKQRCGLFLATELITLDQITNRWLGQSIRWTGQAETDP